MIFDVGYHLLVLTVWDETHPKILEVHPLILSWHLPEMK